MLRERPIECFLCGPPGVDYGWGWYLVKCDDMFYCFQYEAYFFFVGLITMPKTLPEIIEAVEEDFDSIEMTKLLMAY